MAIIRTSSIRNYEMTIEDVKAMISRELNVSPHFVNVDYVIGDIGPEDPMDRYPAPRGVVKLKINVTEA